MEFELRSVLEHCSRTQIFSTRSFPTPAGMPRFTKELDVHWMSVIS